MDAPTPPHLKACTLVGFGDANMSDKIDDRKSTSGT
jgi:hypothetical protein